SSRNWGTPATTCAACPTRRARRRPTARRTRPERAESAGRRAAIPFARWILGGTSLECRPCESGPGSGGNTGRASLQLMTHPALIERITRSLAYMLRHQPEEFDLEVDDHGYAEMGEVIRALNERLGEAVNEDDVREAVE